MYSWEQILLETERLLPGRDIPRKLLLQSMLTEIVLLHLPIEIDPFFC